MKAAIILTILAALMLAPAGFAQDGIGYLDSEPLYLQPAPAASAAPVVASASGSYASGSSGSYSYGSAGYGSYSYPSNYGYGNYYPSYYGYSYPNWFYGYYYYTYYAPRYAYNYGNPHMAGYGQGYYSDYDCYYAYDCGHCNRCPEPQPVYSEQALASVTNPGTYGSYYSIAPSTTQQPGVVTGRRASTSFNVQPAPGSPQYTPPSPKLAWYELSG